MLILNMDPLLPVDFGPHQPQTSSHITNADMKLARSLLTVDFGPHHQEKMLIRHFNPSPSAAATSEDSKSEGVEDAEWPPVTGSYSRSDLSNFAGVHLFYVPCVRTRGIGDITRSSSTGKKKRIEQLLWRRENAHKVIPPFFPLKQTSNPLSRLTSFK